MTVNYKYSQYIIWRSEKNWRPIFCKLSKYYFHDVLKEEVIIYKPLNLSNNERFLITFIESRYKLLKNNKFMEL